MERHVAEDPAYAEALLRDGIETMLADDVDARRPPLHRVPFQLRSFAREAINHLRRVGVTLRYNPA